MLTKSTAPDKVAALQLEFERKFGVATHQRGPLPPDVPQKVADCYVLGRYGGKVRQLVLTEYLDLARVACYCANPDPTRMAYEQVKYLSNAARFAVNKAVASFRRRSGRARVCSFSQLNLSREVEQYFVKSLVDPESELPIKEYEDRENLTYCVEMFERFCLTERERIVLKLVYQGWTFPEIGQELGISRQMAHTIFTNYRKRLIESNPTFIRELKDEHRSSRA